MTMLQVEEMRAEYAKQVEKEEQLVKLEDETASDWDLHSEFCPHKVRVPASDWDLHSEVCPHKVQVPASDCMGPPLRVLSTQVKVRVPASDDWDPHWIKKDYEKKISTWFF